MPHDLSLILTITIGLCAALVFGYLTQLLRLSPIVGYLLAGIAVGPFTPGYVADAGLAEQLAELGVILLMFGVGLHFHFRELLALRRVAIPGAVLQSAVATGLGVAATSMLGWSISAGVVFGLAISVASTVVLIRVLSDANILHSPAGHVAVGWLLVEDLFTVLVLVMLPVLAGSTGGTSDFALSLLGALAKIALLVVFTVIVGGRVIPWFLTLIAETRSRELFTLATLALALGIAAGSAKLFGASMALGAFLAGMIVGQSEFSSRAAGDALPMRDAFAVLFFVSMGMLFDPRQLLPNLTLTLLTLAIVLVGKPVAAFVVVVALRYPVRTAVSVALALAQIGEFSFILAALGRSLDVLPAAATQALVAASIISITLNPVLFHLLDPLTRRLSFGGATPPEEQGAAPGPDVHRAVLVGHGPVGRTLVRLLREQGIEPCVVELNHETVKELSKQGLHAVYGDASQDTILEAAGIGQARALIFTASTPAEGAIREARRLNPDLLIIARSTYLREVGSLKKAGADVVLAAEREVAFAMVEHVLESLGATDEQIDRARDRAREELLPSP